MRIAMLTNNYKPYIGGVPVSIEHLSEELRNLGHRVYIFAPSYPTQEEEPFVIRYPSFPVGVAGAPVPNVLTKLFYKKMAELQIDVIHVHHPAIVGNVAFSMRRQLGIPIVFTYHTRYEEYLYYVKMLKQIEHCTGIIERYLQYYCNHCDMLFAPTPEIKEHLLYEKMVNAPVEILPTGLPQDNFFPDMQTVKSIKGQYQKGADYIFCTVARLAKEKNLDFLLEAMQKVKQRLSIHGKTLRHLIIGEGLERKHLEEKCHKLGLDQEIIFIGNVENKQMKNYLAASDLFVFTSKSETQGIVVLEAMAAGKPVIAVEATGIRDVVNTKENGILAKEDPDSFAQAVEKALVFPKLYQKMCGNAKDTAKKYAEDKIARQAEQYYYELLDFYQNQKNYQIIIG